MISRLFFAVAYACATIFNVEAQILPDPKDYSEIPLENQVTDPLYEPDTGNFVIALTHRTKSKVKYILEGKKIIIWCGEEKIRGRITSISSDCIYLNDVPFPPEDIDKVRAFFPGTTAGGALVTAGGAGAAALGGYIAALSIILLIEAEGEAWAVFFGSLGILASAPLVGIFV